MKVSCIRVSTDLLIGKKHDLVSNYLAKKFLGIGVVLHHLITTQNNPDNIFNALKFLENDTVFIIGESSSSKNYGIKKAIATHLNVALERNEICAGAVANYFKQENSPILTECENEYYIPATAIPLSTKNSYFQGFVLNKEKTYIFLPDDIEFVKAVFDQYLKSILQENNAIVYKTHIIKTFGIYEKDIYSVLNDLVKNIYKILFITYPSELEVTLLIRYNQTLEPEIVQSFLAKVYERLNKYIYADEDVSLATRAMDLLRVSNKTLAVAEAVSGGNIASTLFKTCSDINETVKLALVCPNEESKMKLLNLNRGVLERYGELSIETAYEMAAGLLEVSKADFVLCTTGISESLKPNERKTTFIAVGNMDGIHVYKNTFIGSKETVIENITQTSLFYFIKNLKQNDLLFNETVV